MAFLESKDLFERQRSFRDDCFGGSVSDDEVSQRVLGFWGRDLPNGARAGLLGFVFSGGDESVGFSVAVGSHPEEFDGVCGAVDESDFKGVAVGF